MAITKRGKDKYQIEVIVSYYFDDKGIKKSKKYSEMFYGSKKDAILRQNEIKTEIKKGTFVENTKCTLNEFIDIFKRDYMKHNLQPMTIHGYEWLFVRIKEELGNMKMTDIKPIHLVHFYNKLRQITEPKKLSDNSILHYYVLINRMFVIAIKWGYLTNNPNANVDRPKVKRKELQVYTTEQVQKLISCLEHENLKYKALIYLAIDTGARRGEITGLNWNDVDLDKQAISINKVTQVCNHEIIEKEHPKNNSSVRTINISDTTTEILKQYKAEQENIKQQLGNRWENSNKVFTTETGGLMHPDTPSKIFKKIREKNNLPHLKFHGLRHVSASLQIYNGVHMKVISKRLGHSSSSTTDLIYSHIDNKLDKKVASVFDNVFNEKKIATQ